MKKAQAKTLSIIIVLLALVVSFISIFLVVYPSITGNVVRDNSVKETEEDTSQNVRTNEIEIEENEFEIETEETKATLACVRNCRGRDIDSSIIGEKIWGTPLVSLKSFNTEKIGSKYEVKATFESNTACVVTFETPEGKQIGGIVELEGFEKGEIIIETEDLFDLSILAREKYNNLKVDEYLCNGLINNVAFEFT